jgi:HK97 family phage portal protein
MTTPVRLSNISTVPSRTREQSIAETVAAVPEILDRHGIVVERRAPAAATKNLRWIMPGQATPPDWDAYSAFQLAYYQNVVIYACVRLRANTIASLPLRVGLDPDKPNDYDTQAPLAQLLGPPPGGPAPKLSARRLWAWTVAQRLVTGRNAWEIDLGDGAVPAALWPLAANALKVKKSAGGIEWFSGFTYGRTNDERNLAVDRVVYDWDPSGTDFREPESPLQAANLDIAVSLMQARYDYAFLKNDARPAAIVVTEEFEDEDAYQAFQQQWNSSYGGVENAGRAAFLEAKGAGDQGVKGAVDVTVLGISPKDAQAAQRHTAAMERCAVALGTPWSLLDASGRTFDNAGQEWKNYVLHHVLPMCHDFADMVNMQLAPLFGDGKVCWFDTTSLGIKDMDRLDAQGVALLYEAGVITKDEGRQPFGLPAAPDGTAFKEPPPPVLTPVKIAAEAPHDEVRKMHTFMPDAKDPSVCAQCGKPAVHAAHGVFVPHGSGSTFLAMGAPEGLVREPGFAAPPSPVPAPEPREIDHEARRKKLWNTTQGRVRGLERQWERAVRKLFARQSRAAVARLEGKRGRALVRTRDVRATADEVFDPQHWLSETIDDLTALYEAVVAAGGQRVSDMLGIAFDLEAPWVQDFIKARANQLAGQVTDTTYNAIQDALREGVAEGEGIPELATRIRGVFEDASNVRAQTIARTEVVSAFNGSAVTTANTYGSDVVAGQEWIATQDERTRESHSDLDGAIVGMGETFDNGLAYPGDPSGDPEETVNCRCTIAFLTPEDMAGGGGGRAPRMIETRLAHAVLAMVTPDMDERDLRSALMVAA